MNKRGSAFVAEGKQTDDVGIRAAIPLLISRIAQQGDGATVYLEHQRNW